MCLQRRHHAPAVSAEVIVFFESYTTGEIHYVDSVILRQCTGAMSSVQLWQYMSQQVISGLRGQGDTTEVWVEGANETSPQYIPRNHAASWITDSANATWYDAHIYFDYSGGGGGLYVSSYAHELSVAQAANY
jgi:hypothetical protein